MKVCEVLPRFSGGYLISHYYRIQIIESCAPECDTAEPRLF